MEVEFSIYHVIVIGFHHKKGCQIEYAYPPFEVDLEQTAWKHLPTLAMPDGAHNYASDTVYFHLPSLTHPNQTVFGIACYQQIEADKIRNKGEDITRSTIQKSVCVLSKYPLYGHVQVKMSLITAAYFREGDFSQVSLLEEAFHNLNACLSPDLLMTPETFVGLSPRDLITTFRHDVLILFKLLLLEKRILFRGASVGPLCAALLTLVSLFPHMLEYGLGESACLRTRKALSVVPQFSSAEESVEMEEEFSQDQNKGSPGEKMDVEKPIVPPSNGVSKAEPKEKKAKDFINTSLIQGSVSPRPQPSHNVDTTDDSKRMMERGGDKNDNFVSSNAVGVDIGVSSAMTGCDVVKSPTMSDIGSESNFSIASEKVSDDIPDFLTAVQLTAADAGLPLKLFTKGYLCHPYLSLHYLDLLSNTGVRGFLVGATNILFKQKKDLVDVVVEMQDGSVDIPDQTLKKLVTLTTEDLRFADHLVRNVSRDGSSSNLYSVTEPEDSFMDGVGWEGGDEWIRAQFKYYLMSLMRTSLVEEGHRLRDCFSNAFIFGWQNTHNWKTWKSYVNAEERDTPGIYLLAPGHPYSGQMSVSDMKLRLSHSIQRTEGGRKINKAVGKAMFSTGKAVGGALNQAKGALSSFWNAVTTTTSVPSQAGVEFGEENEETNDTVYHKDKGGVGSSGDST